MISVNGDPRGVCRGKRGVRKREDGAERSRRREREVKKRIIKSNARDEGERKEETEIRQQRTEIVRSDNDGQKRFKVG